jgi:DNA-binding CsgD family transcriptional regulator
MAGRKNRHSGFPAAAGGNRGASGPGRTGLQAAFYDLDGVEQLHQRLQVFVAEVGLDHFFFLAVGPSPGGRADMLMTSNLSAGWCEAYKRNAWLDLDPTAQHCRRRLTPAFWWTVGEHADRGVGGAMASFITRAQEAGLCSGVSFPAQGAHGVWGMLNVSSRDELADSRARLERCMPSGQLLALHGLEMVMRAPKPDPCEAVRPLTGREEECLVWCSEGKTSWEIARILGIAERTVVFHLQNASRKLGAANRVQAVTRAMHRLSPRAASHATRL